MSTVSTRIAAETIFDKYVATIKDALTGDKLIKLLTIDEIEYVLGQYLDVLNQQNKSPDLNVDAFLANVLNNKTDNLEMVVRKARYMAARVSQTAKELKGRPQSTLARTQQKTPAQWKTLSNAPRVAPTLWHYKPRVWTSSIAEYKAVECPLRSVDLSDRVERNPNTAQKLWKKLKALEQLP